MPPSSSSLARTDAEATSNDTQPQTPLWTWSQLEWSWMVPMGLVHLAVLGIFWSGVTWAAVAWCAAWYFIRMFAITGGYHRYFAHRAYRTSRWFQFVLAFLAQTSAQKGALWWASSHRRHHKESDTPNDLHSPRQHGVLYAHILWLFDHTDHTDYERIKDFAKYPELVWLNKNNMVPPVILAVVSFLVLGAPGLFVGFFLSTVILWHATFTINSLSHVFGKRRFETSDDSRNNWMLALLTLGEGWHNNHHHYMHSTRQGFYWWELDITYLILKGLEKLGIVWNLREPPERVLEEGRRNDAAARAS